MTGSGVSVNVGVSDGVAVVVGVTVGMVGIRSVGRGVAVTKGYGVDVGGDTGLACPQAESVSAKHARTRPGDRRIGSDGCFNRAIGKHEGSG